MLVEKQRLGAFRAGLAVHHGTIFFILQVMPRFLSSASKI